MEQIIYLEVDDDILTVRDRLRRAQSKHVLLVVPSGCQGLRRLLDFRLLRRQAASLDMDIALISGSATLRDLASEEGLPVFSRLSQGRRAVRQKRQWQTRDQPGLEGLRARLARQKPRWWHWVPGVITIVLVLGALIWSGIMIWPSATVSVVPAREPIGVSVVVEADPMARAVDWDRMRLPARIVQIEVVDRDEVETTGITNVAADKAVGTVLFVNLTRQQANIPTGTRVSTSAGTPVFFQTFEPVTIGPRGRLRVPIEAVEGGPGGNVGANLINQVEGSLTATVRVINESATSGGTNTQARRVTHGDKQRAQDLLTQKLIQKGHAELSALLEEEFLPIETMWINQYSIQTNYGHHVNDQSNALSLEMRGVVGGLAISEENATEIARQALHRQIRSGFHLMSGTAHFSRGDLLGIDEETGVVRFLMEGVALTEAEIDETLLRKAIRGRPIDQALAYLRQTLPVETEPTLQVSPDWMIRVPWMPFRITVVKGERPKEIAHALPGA
jgi:hypothetical protein